MLVMNILKIVSLRLLGRNKPGKISLKWHEQRVILVYCQIRSSFAADLCSLLEMWRQIYTSHSTNHWGWKWRTSHNGGHAYNFKKNKAASKEQRMANLSRSRQVDRYFNSFLQNYFDPHLFRKVSFRSLNRDNNYLKHPTDIFSN